MLDRKESVLYANVIGLGLRSLKSDPIGSGINLLPEEVKSQAKKSQQETQRSVFLVALFIVIAGLLLLGMAVYYLVYLPVPAPMQPLKNRIMLVLEESKNEMVDVAFISDDTEEEITVYNGPGDESGVVGYVSSGEIYMATGQRAGWVRITMEDNEGWIDGDQLKGLKTMEVEEFKTKKEESNFKEEEVSDEE